jgi:hypothetical protein
MIVESIIKGLKNEPITLKDETVESTNPYLPKLFNCGMWIGAKGTGKTWSLVRLLRHYEDSPIVDKKGRIHEMRTILFCPTGNSNFNSIYKSLKTLDQEKDIILDYSDDKLLEILDEIAEEEKEIKEYYKYLKSYERFKKNKMKDKDLLFLDKYDFKDPIDLLNEKDNLLKMMKPKYKQYRINFLIFDDLVGDPRAFKRNNGRLNNLTIKCRHHHCSMLFTTQYPKAIPPTIRANIDTWVLFRFASKERVLEQVYPEISSLITIEHFEELYTYATKTSSHDALVIDNHGKSNTDMKFRKNWNVVLKVS